MFVNHFKNALQARQLQIGLWASFGDAYATEIVASTGFDWLLLDAEHGPNDLRSVLAQVQAMGAYSTHPVVRLPVGDVVLIKQYLDAGAHTLLIPMVESGEQAKQMVAATRYPPHGIRGVASARSSSWGAVSDYYHRASDAVCLLLQVESIEGLEHLSEILEVEGVDGIFIGPSDLAATMGHLGNPGHPDVIAVIEPALRQIVAAGKAAGILTADQALAQRYIACGVTFCAVGVDTLMLAQAARTLVRKFKHELPPPPEIKLGATY